MLPLGEKHGTEVRMRDSTLNVDWEGLGILFAWRNLRS